MNNYVKLARFFFSTALITTLHAETYTTDFTGITTGDLNGQDNWVAQPHWDADGAGSITNTDNPGGANNNGSFIRAHNTSVLASTTIGETTTLSTTFTLGNYNPTTSPANLADFQEGILIHALSHQQGVADFAVGLGVGLFIDDDSGPRTLELRDSSGTTSAPIDTDATLTNSGIWTLTTSFTRLNTTDYEVTSTIDNDFDSNPPSTITYTTTVGTDLATDSDGGGIIGGFQALPGGGATPGGGSPTTPLYDDITITDYSFTTSQTFLNANDSGPGSLRQAISDASPGDTITFNPSLSGQTITLTSGQLTIDKNLTIDASALPNGLTIDGNQQSRILEVTSSNTVALHSLTLTGGKASGTMFPSNSGGAISNGGNLTLTACTLSGNSAEGGGGGISNKNSATLTLTACTLSGNSADFGGGIFNQSSGDMTLNACTLSGNFAVALGGGISKEPSSSTELNNTIVARNNCPNGPDIRNDGNITTSGKNLLSDLTDSNLSAGPTIIIATDPKLSPLGWYGGSVQTIHPLANSPAIDAAGTTDPGGTDARGFSRFVNGTLDIGAVEAGPILLVTDSGDSGPGTLRQAIADADATPLPGQRVLFDPAAFPATITLTAQLATSATTPEGLFIDASNIPGSVTIDGNGSVTNQRILEITPNNTVALHSLTLTGGNAAGLGSLGRGGAIFNDESNLTLSTCTLFGNLAFFGGGIFNDGIGGNANLILSACTLSGNAANTSGGGIHNNATSSGNATVTLDSCTVTRNSNISGTFGGGGIYSNGSSGTATLNLTNTIVADNTAASELDISAPATTTITSGKNLLSDLNGSGLSAGSSIIVDSNPKLSPLSWHGGPVQTIHPLAGSPAIDPFPGSSSTSSLYDARGEGFPRLVGGTLDIGAVEAGATQLPATPTGALYVDFNSNQDEGGDSSTSPAPNLSTAHHNQIGYQSYHANHQAAAEFTTASYPAFGTTITLTPSWPDSSNPNVQQSVDRGNQDNNIPFQDVIDSNDANWNGDKLNLLTDWIGVDTRTGQGGNGDYDGSTGSPTRIRLTLGNLPAGDYRWLSYHHDTENNHTGFELRISTDGGSSFTTVGTDFIGTNSSPGGNPASPQTYDGTTNSDPANLPSTAVAFFNATGSDDVIVEFTPLSNTGVNRQQFALNGFELINTTIVDTIADSGPGSLRTAIEDSNTQAITFDPALDGQTITLGSFGFFINKELIIDASALPNGLTVDANQLSRVLSIASDKTVALHNLTLIGGKSNSGGGIYNQGNLTLTACTLSGNSANFGGGGIFNDDRGTLTLTACTLSGNTASEDGGGIFNEFNATMTLTACTLSGNSSSDGGGAYASSGSTMTLTACTLSGNSARVGGGIFIETFASMTLTDTIIAENTALFRPDISDNDIMVSINTNGKNLFSDLDGSTLSAGPTIIVATDPKLSPLGWYGGPVQTIHPLAGSPAIDAAGTTNPGGTDARGFNRFVNGTLDIGAVEAGPVLLVTDAGDSGPGTLRQTLADADATPIPGQRILFDPTVFDGEPTDTITLAGQLGTSATTPEGLFIDASNIPGSVTIDGNGSVTNQRILEITPNNTIALHSLTLTGGNAAGPSPDGRGGAIYHQGLNLTLTACTLSGNSASSGGGISGFGEMTLTACTLSRNSAGDGGGIFNDGTLTLTACTLSGNSANFTGGGISGFGDMTLTTCTLSGNSAGDGGGIYSVLGNITLTSCTLSENSATSFGGGGIYNDSTSTTLIDTIVAGNTARFGPDILNTGNITTSGKNLLSDTTDSGLLSGTTIIVDSDPKLSPLGWYGGPVQTIHPLADSPAIDAAGTTDPGGTDARGFHRFVDGNNNTTAALDIGAVEAGPILLVTDAGDSGPGTMRQTLADADTTPIPGQRILFDSTSFPATITLTAQLATSATTPEGLFIDASNIPGSVTIDGDGSVTNQRILEVTPNNTIALHSLKLINGKTTGPGGAILNNQSTLTLSACTLADNEAGQGGGLLNGGSLGSASLAIHHSTISGNSSTGFGGGIYNDGNNSGSASLILNNSTVSGNTATGVGGGIYNNAFASGFAHLTLNHATLHGNDAGTQGGGIYNDSGAGGNAGIQLSNSIIAVNTAVASGPDLRNDAGSIILSGLNLLTDLTSSDLVDDDNLDVADPLLAPLGNNGGPTETMLPLPNSPALNAASSTALTPSLAGTDQRGFKRLSGPAKDIGATELQAIVVNTNAEENDGIFDGDISLRDAVSHNGVGEAEYISFDPGVTNIVLASGLGQITIDRNLIIDASTPSGTVTINGDNNSRIFEINSGANVLLRGLTLINGSHPNRGGAIEIQQNTPDSSVTLLDCTIHSCNAFEGGGIYSYADPLRLENCTLTNNTGDFGGAIQTRSPLEIVHSTISENTATNGGGGIWIKNDTAPLADVTLSNSIVSENLGSGGRDLQIDPVGGTVTYSGTNLVASTLGSGFSGTTPLGDPPFLAPLGNYVGTAQTMPPLPGSPAIEGAVSLANSPALDQIGNTRPAGPLPDLGAVEALPLGSLGLASTDGDTIPDILEGPATPYPFLNPTVDDSTLDTDGDGSTDAGEIANMTNPLDPTDYFRILSFTKATGFDPQTNPVFDLTFTTFPGLSYSVENNPDLQGNFTPLGSSMEAHNTTMTLQVTLEPNKDFIQVTRE